MLVGILTNRYFIIFTVSLLALTYIDYKVRDAVETQIELEQLKGYKETRERLDEAEDNSPTTVDNILEWLSERQSE